MIEIRWHGRGGQGAFTASKILGAAAVQAGNFALAFPSFGPERRGAPIQAFTKIGKQPISDRSVIHKCDYIIYLDETLYHPGAIQDLKAGGRILINTAQPDKYADERFTALNADDISREILGRPVSNTAMLGLLAVVSGVVDTKQVKESLRDYLPAKIADKNKLVIDKIAEQTRTLRQSVSLEHKKAAGGDGND